MSKETGKSQKGRVLFTGNGERLIDNLVQHIPDQYESSTCGATEPEFRKALGSCRPHVVVVCLMSETREALRMYDILVEDMDYVSLPVIAIGREEDCDLFRKKVVVKNLDVFPRPLDNDRFLKMLAQFVQESKALEATLAAKEAGKKSLGMRMDFQVDEDDTPPPKPARKPEPEKDPFAQQCILVVDDDVRMLNAIKLHLKDMFDVAVVPSGKLALKYLEKKSADLVLLDYMMPDMDGPAVLQQIREESSHPDIPVVFLTGVSDKDLVMRGLEFHPNGYLLKPVKQEVLLEKVTEILLGL